MEHLIENQPLPLFFRRVFLEKLSGRLAVTVKDFRMTLDFADGKLANAGSTRFDEKLLVILHLMGKLTEEQYNFSSGLHQFPDDQVGDILLEHRFVKKKDLYYARIYQQRRIAVSLFSLSRGNWDFNASIPAPPENVEIPLAGIIAEGARTIERISWYSNRWLFHAPKTIGEIPHHLDVYFTTAEREFHSLLLIDGQRTCRELIARLDLQPIDFWRKVLVFHLLGILEFEKSQSDADITREIAELLLLQQRIQRAGGDDRNLLGLAADASATAIENAQSQLLARFSPERFGSAAAPEIKRIARDVCRRIQGIWPPAPGDPAAPPTAAPVPATELPESPHHKAWNLYLKGKEWHGQKEFAKAIEALKQAIKLEPGQGDFYFLLGLCQSETELTRSEAEVNLKRAIELTPWSAEPVYALGLLFRAQKKMKMAERCFQRVKEIAAEHSGASQALVDLRRLRPGKKNKLAFLKKKIF